MRRFIVILCVVLGVHAASAGENDQVLEGFVYPIKDNAGVKIGELRGAKATISEKGMIHIENLEWVSLEEGGQNMRVTTPRCRFNTESKVISSYADISIEKGGILMTGTGYICDVQSKRLVIVDNARVVFTNIELWSDHAKKKE